MSKWPTVFKLYIAQHCGAPLRSYQLVSDCWEGRVYEKCLAHGSKVTFPITDDINVWISFQAACRLFFILYSLLVTFQMQGYCTKQLIKAEVLCLVHSIFRGSEMPVDWGASHMLLVGKLVAYWGRVWWLERTPSVSQFDCENRVLSSNCAVRGEHLVNHLGEKWQCKHGFR